MMKGPVTDETVFNATVEGALLRVRPKIMTVATTVIGLLLVAIGFVSFTRLALREYPDIDRPVVSVTTSLELSTM